MRPWLRGNSVDVMTEPTTRDLMIPRIRDLFEATTAGHDDHDRVARRAGDVERTATCEALAEHFVAGRLGLDELENRLGWAVRAVTEDELRRLTADLPRTSTRPPNPPPTPTLPDAQRDLAGGRRARRRRADRLRLRRRWDAPGSGRRQPTSVHRRVSRGQCGFRRGCQRGLPGDPPSRPLTRAARPSLRSAVGNRDDYRCPSGWRLHSRPDTTEDHHDHHRRRSRLGGRYRRHRAP